MAEIIMLTLKFSPTANKSRLNTIKNKVAADKPKMLNDCGQRLVGLARIYFDNLSNGGAGYSGRSWPALKESTIKKRESMLRNGKLRASVDAMGIASGRMRSSLRYEVSGNRLSVRYDAPESRYFTVHRRLIPTVLPTPWRNACDEIVQGDLNSIT